MFRSFALFANNMFNLSVFERTRFSAYEQPRDSGDSSSLNSLLPTSISPSIEQSTASKSKSLCWVLKFDEEL